MMVGPGMPSRDRGMPSRDRDGLDELEAIAALEGFGVLTERQRALVDEERVRELEHAAGALFTALGRARVREAPEDAQRRLEGLLSTQVAADGQETRGRGSSHLHDTLRGLPQRGASRGDISQRDHSGSLSSEGAAVASSPEVDVAPGTGGLRPAPFLLGWVAAAALLIATVVAYGRVVSLEQRLGEVPADVRLQELVATTPDVEVLPWATDGIGGDVTWSNAKNEGFLRIDGLAVNDPAVAQYQLWIFRGLDPSAEAHPVSGGVFDVDREGQVIVPIDAQLELGRAGMFVVTVEKPGGVMVDRKSVV